MGLIKAVAGSISGGLADQWLEVIEPDDMGPTTIMVRGVKVKSKRSSNTKTMIIMYRMALLFMFIRIR